MIPLDLRPPELRRRRTRRTALNVTSLIDVLFLLLIFLMVSSTFVEHPALELELPRAGAAEPVRRDTLSLAVTREGELHLDGERVGAEELARRLEAAAQDDPDVLLVLEADRRVGYGVVIAAIDAAKRAGIRRLSAFTEAPEPPASGTGRQR